jgi:hypothetical protein
MKTGTQKTISHLSVTQLARKLAGVGMTGFELYIAKMAPLVNFNRINQFNAAGSTDKPSVLPATVRISVFLRISI